MAPSEPGDRKRHWEEVYSTRAPGEVSWYQRRPAVSLDLIRASGIGPGSRIVDVGGGASTLVDHLLEEGFGPVTVVDVAEAALAASRHRLGPLASQVEWVVADVTGWRPPAPFDLWHDRAVFHFLTEAADRRGYLDALGAGLRPGGHAVIATFAPDGPERCSGLPVRRYDPAMLGAELGPDFALEEMRAEEHVTPAGKPQRFVYCRFRRTAGA